MSDALTLYGLLDDDEIPIDAVALELSALDHHRASIKPYLELIDQMAAQVLALDSETTTPAHNAAVLVAVLSGENAFTGDRQSYDAPVNADMIRVFDRRKGLPISLAIIYVAVARRLGWAAYVVNLPGHVLVSIGEDDTVLIDAFDDGAVLGVDELDSMRLPGVNRSIVTAQALRMSNRDVLVRLLQNQASRAEQSGDYERAVLVYGRMKTVAPDNAQGWSGLVRLQLMFGATGPARTSLISLLEITRDPGARSQISQVLGNLAGE
ncbi:SirB1 family protein [Novosphingobium sp.]|uniref:SirB1 family protein n=1 Tax=Novosphingobium sp. TaxID=1874826 RepID=UPI003D0A10CC